MIPGAKSALNIENCSCPVEYKGKFCEQCANGYTRVTPKGGPYVTCVPCDTQTSVTLRLECVWTVNTTPQVLAMKIKEAKNFLEGRNWINKIGGVRKYC